MDSRIFQYVREDDFVECFIFPLLDGPQTGDDFINEIFQDVQEIINVLSQRYIWHKDVFKVHKRLKTNNALAVDSDSNLPAHIYGVCHFGDNIKDEWFIVYMVKEITLKINSLVAKIVDSDGEFLLIEAANSLPSWANPSNCSNRVFFYKGCLHLINPDRDDDVKDLSLNDALLKLHSNNEEYAVSANIQNDVFQNIDEYPNKINEELHRCTVYTPTAVAALLKEEPQLLAAAVHAFCNRDPIDLKACRAMKYFPPENRVNTSVTFTKFLYAMLLHNNFTPDRRTGWNLPLINSPQYKSHSLGIKLACGFEILVSQAQPGSSLDSNKAWKDYLQCLKNRNYFQELLEGSNVYNGLLDNAKEYFTNNLNFMKTGPKLGERILEMLGGFSLDEKEFRKSEASLPNDDDDKWLYVDPKELENMVQKRYGRKTFFPVNGQTEPSEFSSKLSEFLDHRSGIDGVEFPDQSEGTSDSNFPQRPKRGIKTKKNHSKGVSFSDQTKSRSPSPSAKNKIDFDADQFSGAIQNILDLVIPEDDWDLDSGSDVSEYGSSDELETNILGIASSEVKDKNAIDRYMAKMDSELAETDLAKSFQTSKSNGVVDIDVNALKNMQQSYQEEMGGAGPAGSILGPLGYTKSQNITAIDDEVD